MRMKDIWKMLPVLAVPFAVAIAEGVAGRGLNPTECPQCDSGNGSIVASTVSEPCLGVGGLSIETRWYAPDPPCIDEKGLCTRCCKEGKTAYWSCLITYNSLNCLSPEYSCKSECCEDAPIVDYIESAACPGRENQILVCPPT